MINKSEKTALFISPHLDDVIFSCGGTLAKMSADGWHTMLCTIFTKSVINPQGFALACQLDKGLTPEVDYMKLRRAEDASAARLLGVSEILHLSFPEAPHRGYNSAPELFEKIKSGDEVWRSVAEHFAMLDEIHQPELIFAPQGLGNHCDHLQAINAVLEVFSVEKINWYYDTPYVIKQPNAEKYDRLPEKLVKKDWNITDHIDAKINACAKYASQIGFQFGGEENLKKTLLSFHRQTDDLYISNDSNYKETFLSV